MDYDLKQNSSRIKIKTDSAKGIKIKIKILPQTKLAASSAHRPAMQSVRLPQTFKLAW